MFLSSETQSEAMGDGMSLYLIILVFQIPFAVMLESHLGYVLTQD